ncbi:30S ribosomal subunit protein S5 [Alphaproteobacteria bacterium]
MAPRLDNQNAEITEKLVYVGRCAKVVKGGRRFSFLTVVVVGDGKGKVGIGKGKASEIVDARAKAVQAAKKKMIRVPLRDGRTLHHDITAKFGAGKIVMRAAPAGTGIIAGGAVRALLETLGIKDVVAKSIGSTNPHNMLKAAIEALINTRSPRSIAEKRGKRIADIVSRREKYPKELQNEEDKTKKTASL